MSSVRTRARDSGHAPPILTRLQPRGPKRPDPRTPWFSTHGYQQAWDLPLTPPWPPGLPEWTERSAPAAAVCGEHSTRVQVPTRGAGCVCGSARAEPRRSEHQGPGHRGALSTRHSAQETPGRGHSQRRRGARGSPFCFGHWGPSCIRMSGQLTFSIKVAGLHLAPRTRACGHLSPRKAVAGR